MALEIDLIPALSDNYIYLVRDPETGTVAVVDPGEAAPVIEVLDQRELVLDLILNTHHHGDHIGGNAELKETYGARLIGPASEAERIADMDQMVAAGDMVAIGNEEARVFEIPGHTRGHIAFWFPEADALFAGDTMFSLGCGRLFEGTPAEMWESLKQLRALPDSAHLYCGHEYTQSNARFALSIDGGNAALKAHAVEIDGKRAKGEPTIPALLGREKKTNPFLRADDPALMATMGGSDAIDTFAKIRAAKDSF